MTHDDYSGADAEATTLLYLESGIAVILLGSSDERVVTITPRRIASLNEVLDELGQDRPKGLVITGPHPAMFSVGIDANYLASLTSADDARRFVREGQRACERIRKLPFPTVAAISGACLGAGCEIALSCDCRLVSDNEASVMGFPERKLGVIPGFGGLQQLPRVTGLPVALDLLMNARIVTGSQAVRLGLAREVVTYDRLLDRAEELAAGKAPLPPPRLGLLKRFLTCTRLGRKWVARRAGAEIAKASPGFRPALSALLEAILIGFDSGRSPGLLFEVQQFTSLTLRPETKALIKLFFASESTKALGRAGRNEAKQVQAAVLGAGRTGTVIAELLARSGCPVILKDVSNEALGGGVQRVRQLLKKVPHLSDPERSFILNRVNAARHEAPVMTDVNLLIEAVSEDLALKRRLLTEAEGQIADEAVMASCSASLPIAELAAGLTNPSRLLGLHFFQLENSQLVEIVRGPLTSGRAVSIAAALASRLGRYPIVVHDRPGFLVNRLMCLYLNEAGYLLEEGVSPAQLEQAALAFGMAAGPLRLVDENGLEQLLALSRSLQSALGDRFRPPALFAALAEQARTGKNGAGKFYRLRKGEEQLVEDLAKFLPPDPQPGTETISVEMVQDRLLIGFVNEAVRCFDEGVAGTPGAEAAKQINLASVFGLGFPAYRGGVLEYADKRGAAALAELARVLAAHVGARLAPAQGIECRAANAESFQAACP